MASRPTIEIKPKPVLQQQSKEALLKLKENVLLHKTGLTKSLIKHFAPRPMPAIIEREAKKPKKLPYTGVSDQVQLFEEQDSEEKREKQRPEKRKFNNREYPYQSYIEEESKKEKRERITQIKLKQAEKDIEEGVSKWDPQKDPNIEGDPYKTLFVARISYDVTEKKLKKEFDRYGPVKRVRMVLDRVNLDKSGKPKPRGYAFVEFEHKADMREAYKRADGTKLENKRVLVDAERGRTVENWRPRRLGGGKGGETRRPVEKVQRPDDMPELLNQIPETIITTLKPDGGKPRDRRERERSIHDKDRHRDQRDKEKDRERRKEKDREREKDKDKDREKDRRGEKDRGRDKERETKRQKKEDNSIGEEDGKGRLREDIEMEQDDKVRSERRSERKDKNRDKDDKHREKDKKDKDKKERKEKHKDKDRTRPDERPLQNPPPLPAYPKIPDGNNNVEVKMEEMGDLGHQNGFKEEEQTGQPERLESRKRGRDGLEWDQGLEGSENDRFQREAQYTNT